MRICLFEDAVVSNLQPLSDTRPAFDLRCGARSLLERQLHAFDVKRADALVRRELADLCRLQHAELTVNNLCPAPHEKIIFVNARWLPPAKLPTLLENGEVGLCEGQLAYLSLPSGTVDSLQAANVPLHPDEWADKLPIQPAGGRMIGYPWHLIEHHAEALEQDYQLWSGNNSALPATALPVVGPQDRCLLHPSARVEPFVVIDTTKGPVLIDRDAVVRAFSRIEGPCYIGAKTHVLGAKLSDASLGPQCRIGGEVEATIVQGYSNKAHEGFLGHSYLGEWVNLGAGTQVSDLRTDYAPVSINRNGRSVNTGLMKLGAFVGDHTKTSISALINTGSVFGPFGQLLTSGALLPRNLPAFCRFGHGQIQPRNDLRQLFATAAIAMSRREQVWTETHTEFYLDLYDISAAERQCLIRESEQRRLRRVV